MLPVAFDDDTIHAYQPNGMALRIAAEKIEQPRAVARFRPLSPAEMRTELLQEFGQSFEVSGTGTFLVVHPQGARDRWAGRFEELYRSLTHFFKARGYPLSRPQFPLVGIVFHSRRQYIEYQARLGGDASDTYGCYLPGTNRIYLYDATQGTGRKSEEWAENLATVMHETAHQTAFNIGIHRRAAKTPRWVAEGLGCLFEARGIYNAFHYRNQSDRISFRRLHEFREVVMGDAATILADMICSDDRFRSRKYAMAWALTFYLSEKQPRGYADYLRHLSKRPLLQPYPVEERIRDFATFFGKDIRMLAARIERFIGSLPTPPANT